MSDEKKVRELLDQTRVIMGPIRRFDDEVQKALSEPPDVVVLLRWLREEQAETLHSACWTEDHKTGLLNAFAVVVDRITEKFHVRLTDDGWEWVEDGE